MISHASEPPPVLEKSFCCFNGVGGLAVDAEGNIYVGELFNHRIVKLGPDGSTITTWATDRPGPFDVQVDGNGVVWVGSGTGPDNALHRYTSNGTLISLFTQFNSLFEFAFGPGGVVYVLDHHFGNVRKYSGDGTLITIWSLGGFAGGRPVGIAVDSNGLVYVGVAVGSFETGEIRIYSPEGTLLGTVPNQTRGGMLRIDSKDHLYQTVGTAAGTEVRKFTKSGEILWQIPGGQFFALALDAQGKVYVGDGEAPNSKIHIFAQVVEVAIDIKPGSFPNSINPRSEGVIPVAILTTDTFDATTVDETTVLFGATGTQATPVHFALEDVDGDGDTDMILHFNTQDTGIVCGDTSASLTGETFDGQMIEGSDSVKTAGCK